MKTPVMLDSLSYVALAAAQPRDLPVSRLQARMDWGI